jgi:hypothetical protein
MCLIRTKKAGQAQQGHFHLFDIETLAGSLAVGDHFSLSLLARAARPPHLVPPRPGSDGARGGESWATAGVEAGSRGKVKLPRALLT